MSRESVNSELFKFTEEYKKQSSNTSLIHRYFFTPNNNEEPDKGSLLFTIKPQKLYDDNINLISDIDMYFKYESLKGRFLNKNIRVCNIPLGVLTKNGENIIENLSNNVVIDETGILAEKQTYSKISSTVFGKQYSVIDFFNNTGIFLSIYKIVKNSNNQYCTYKIPSNNYREYGDTFVENIKVSVMSSNYFDIEFTDLDKNSELYILEINKSVKSLNSTSKNEIRFYGEKSDKEINTNDKYIYANCAHNESNDFIYEKIEYNNFLALEHFKTIYLDQYFIDGDNLKFTIDVSKLYPDEGSPIDFSKDYIDKSQLIIWMYNYAYNDTFSDRRTNMILPIHISQENSVLNISVPKDYAIISKDNNIHLDIYSVNDFEVSKITERNINTILSSYGLEDLYEPVPEDGDYTDYFPEYFRHELEKQCKSYTGKISSINKNFTLKLVEDKNDGLVTTYTPCIRLEFPICHSGIMFFQNGSLISPYIYFEGEHTLKVVSNGEITNEIYGVYGNMYMYISLYDLAKKDSVDALINNNNENLLNLDSPLYVVLSNTFFEENVAFPLYMIKDKVKNDVSARYFYEEGTYVNNEEGNYYKLSDNEYVQIEQNDIGNDIRYKLVYEEVSLGTNSYYKKNYIKDPSGDYISLLTNEYIIPVNKNLDINNITIVSEDMVEYNYDDEDPISGIKYATDNEGTTSIVYIEENSSFVKKFIKYGSFSLPSADNLDNYYTMVINDNNISFEPYEIPGGLFPVVNNNLYYKSSISYGDETKDLYAKCNTNGKIIRYQRVYYKYSIMLNNIKYYSEKSDRCVYSYDDETSTYKKYLPDEEYIREFRKFNDIIKIKIMNGEIIDCGFPDTDEFLTLIDCGRDVVFDDDHTAKEIIDLQSSRIETIEDGHIIAFNTSSGYSQYFNNDEDEQFLSYVIPHQIMNSEGKMLAFLDGILTDEFVINKNLYYRLFDGNTMLSFSDDPIDGSYKYIIAKDGDYIYDNTIDSYIKATDDTDPDETRYKKCILNVYITNLGNYTLYQDIHGVSTNSDGVITLKNTVSEYILNEQKMYSDIYMVPFSTKYMLVFVNGKYMDPDSILVLSNKSFAIKKDAIQKYFPHDIYHEYYDDTRDAFIIKELFIYKYDNINPLKFADSYYGEKVQSKLSYIHPLTDYLWDKYGDGSSSQCITSQISANIMPIIIDPKDPGFHKENTRIALYEIFGKYILNKYDIDSDFELSAEIKSYFRDIYDADGRMRMELNLDSDKRKYTY